MSRWGPPDSTFFDSLPHTHPFIRWLGRAVAQVNDSDVRFHPGMPGIEIDSAWYPAFRVQYPELGVGFWASWAGVFAVQTVHIQRNVFALVFAVPGDYRNDAVDLWIWNANRGRITQVIRAASHYGDAGATGDDYAWLTDVTGDHTPDLVRRHTGHDLDNGERVDSVWMHPWLGDRFDTLRHAIPAERRAAFLIADAHQVHSVRIRSAVRRPSVCELVPERGDSLWYADSTEARLSRPRDYDQLFIEARGWAPDSLCVRLTIAADSGPIYRVEWPSSAYVASDAPDNAAMWADVRGVLQTTFAPRHFFSMRAYWHGNDGDSAMMATEARRSIAWDLFKSSAVDDGILQAREVALTLNDVAASDLDSFGFYTGGESYRRIAWTQRHHRFVLIWSCC